MILIFWQDMVSEHQLPYISQLPKLDEKINVLYVAKTQITEMRLQMGWQYRGLHNTERIRFEIDPDLTRIRNIISQNQDAYHFFSGIRAFPMVFYAFKYSLQFQIKRYLIVEGPSYFKRPRILHIVRTFVLDKKYYSSFEKVFAIGKDAREWYKFWGLGFNRIIPFSYSVPYQSLNQIPATRNNAPLKLVFVGRLIPLKGVSELFKALKKLTEPIQLDIIGDGVEMIKLRRDVEKVNSIHTVKFLGTKPNEEIRQMLPMYDCLILPSLYDGWGAVVNEGLMSGLFVLCSDKCGAQDLILKGFNGLVFSHKNKGLVNALNYCIINLIKIRRNKPNIYQWSKCLRPEKIAEYFLESLLTKTVSLPPWKRPIVHED